MRFVITGNLQEFFHLSVMQFVLVILSPIPINIGNYDLLTEFVAHNVSNEEPPRSSPFLKRFSKLRSQVRRMC